MIIKSNECYFKLPKRAKFIFELKKKTFTLLEMIIEVSIHNNVTIIIPKKDRFCNVNSVHIGRCFYNFDFLTYSVFV